MTPKIDVIAPTSVASAASVLAETWAEGQPTIVADVAGPESDASAMAVISLRRLNRVVELDVENGVLVAEAGLTVGASRAAASAAGLWCPALRWLPGDTTIGAAVAAGHGRRSRRYGTVPDYVLGLRFASPAVGLARHGGKAIKNATGYNLSGMVAGSRGALGVILEVTLRLLPRPRRRSALVYAIEKPVELWRAGRILASRTGGSSDSALAPAQAGLAAIEGWATLHSSECRLLVETEGTPLGAPQARMIGSAGASLTFLTALSEEDNWPETTTGQRFRLSFNPGRVDAELDRIASATRDSRVDGYIVAELTGGAVELVLAAPPEAPLDIRNVLGLGETPDMRTTLTTALKSAFDPTNLLGTSPP